MDNTIRMGTNYMCGLIAFEDLAGADLTGINRMQI